MDPRYAPDGVEARWQTTWEAEGLYAAGAGARHDDSYVICVPPPNVTGELHIGHALNGSLQDVLIRWHRMRGFDTLWQPGYDHAGIATQNVVEKALAERRALAPRPRARGVRRAHVGVAREDRSHDHGPVPAARLLARLLARALHDGRRLRPSGHDVLRPALGARLDLPGEPDRELVPVPPDGDLRSRGRARGDGRHAGHDPLPLRGRRRHGRCLDRDGASGDDPRRRRGRGPSGRPAVQRRDRSRGDRPVRRAARSRDRRRAHRPRVRDGRAQGHPRSRSARLRHRTRPRAARADGRRLGRAHERGCRRPRRAHPGGGRGARSRVGGGAGARREARAVPALGRNLREVSFAHRAAHLAAVVVRDEGAGGASDRGAAGAPRPLPPRVAASIRDHVARGDARLVHLEAALVGASAPDLDVPGRPPHRPGRRAVGLHGVRVGRARAGDRRARHVVLVGALAVRDARLAGRDARARALLPGKRQFDGARDHSPLGEPDDLDWPRGARGDPVHRRDHPLDGACTRRAAHVEEPRDGHRPDGAHRGVRRGRDALRPPEDLVHAGRALLVRGHRGGTEARDQALERRAAHPPERRGHGAEPRAARPRGALDPRPARCRPRRARGRVGALRLRGVDGDALPPRVRRLLRLVRGGDQAAAVRPRRSLRSRPHSRHSNDCSCCCTRSCRTRPKRSGHSSRIARRV